MSMGFFAPVPRNDRLLDNAMLWRIAALTPVAVAVTFGWFAWRQSGGLPYDLVRKAMRRLRAKPNGQTPCGSPRF
jgi:hypothetical protein